MDDFVGVDKKPKKIRWKKQYPSSSITLFVCFLSTDFFDEKNPKNLHKKGKKQRKQRRKKKKQNEIKNVFGFICWKH